MTIVAMVLLVVVVKRFKNEYLGVRGIQMKKRVGLNRYFNSWQYYISKLLN